MPIYEYWCEACDKRFSLLLKMSSGAPEKPCPTCGGTAKKQISSCAIGSSGSSSPSCSIGGTGGGGG